MIHAVVGQNGAGKTTFARVAAGIVQPVGGHARDRRPRGAGRQCRRGPCRRRRARPPELCAAAVLHRRRGDGVRRRRAAARIYTRQELERRWARHLDCLGVKVSPRERIRDLPVETQQAVEIARALVTDAKVLILDEPTAVLSPSGIDKLFERLKVMQASGVTIILILHKIREVLAIADTVTVLRGGRLVEGPVPTAEHRRRAASPRRSSVRRWN